MENFVDIIDNALSDKLCKKIIKIFDRSPNQQPGKTGGGVDKSMKDSTDISIQKAPEFESIRQDVLAATTKHVIEYFKKYHFALIGPVGLTLQDPTTGKPVKLTSQNWESVGLARVEALVQHIFQVGDINAQKYKAGSGGYPYWHSEIYPQPNTTEALHRTLLFMFYLNDVKDGGETEFYYQQQAIQPKTGRMVIAPAGFTHTHRGNTPKSNDKYILTSWILFNPGQAIYGTR